MTASVARSARPAWSATISLVGRSTPAAATRAASPPEGLTPSFAPRRATTWSAERRRCGRRRRSSTTSVSPAAAAMAASVGEGDGRVHRGRAVRRVSRGAGARAGAHDVAAARRAPADRRLTQAGWRTPHQRTTFRVRRRTAISATSWSSSARQVSQAEIGFASRPLEQAGLGEFGEHGGADRQDEHDPRREPCLSGRRDRVAVLPRRGLQREREVAQQRGQVAARVALQQDAGDHRVPGGRARAPAQPLEHELGPGAEAQGLARPCRARAPLRRGRRRRRSPAPRARRARPRARPRTRGRRRAPRRPATRGTAAFARARVTSPRPGRRRRRSPPRPLPPRTIRPPRAPRPRARRAAAARRSSASRPRARRARSARPLARSAAATRVRSTAASSSHAPTTAAAAAPNASTTAISGHARLQDNAE